MVHVVYISQNILCRRAVYCTAPAGILILLSVSIRVAKLEGDHAGRTTVAEHINCIVDQLVPYCMKLD